jgi:hypothetical protein
MSTPPEKEEAPDRWSFTFVFKETAQAAKLAGYWSRPIKDELKLERRGWPAPGAWNVLELTVRDTLVHMVGECGDAVDVDPLPEPLRKGVSLALVRAVQCGIDQWFCWAAGRPTDPAKVFDRAEALELYDADTLFALALASAKLPIVKRAIEKGPSRAALSNALFHENMATIVRALLGAGADPFVRGGYGETLLMHWACDLPIVSFLLKAGVDPNAGCRDVTSRGDTPLSIAVDGRADRCVKALIKAGADVDAGGLPPLQIAGKKLYEATEYNNPADVEGSQAILEALLSRGAQRGLGELMYYAERSREVRAIVEAFGKSGAKQAPAREGSLARQLHEALCEGDLEGAAAIVDRIMAADARDALEASSACVDALELLHERGAPGAQTIEGYLRRLGARRREWNPVATTAALPILEVDQLARYQRETRTDVSVRVCFERLEVAERFATYARGERGARSALMAAGFPDPDAWQLDRTLHDGRSIRLGIRRMPNQDVDPLLEQLTRASAALVAIVYSAGGYMPLTPSTWLIKNPVRSVLCARGGEPSGFGDAFARVLEQDASLALSIALEHRDDKAAQRAAAAGADPLAPADALPALFHAGATPELALQLLDNASVDTRLEVKGATLYRRWAGAPNVIERLEEHAAGR